MSNPNHTLIALVLDASGSMKNIKNSTIEGINTFIDSQKTLTTAPSTERPIDLTDDLSGGASVLTCDLTLVQFCTPNSDCGYTSLGHGIRGITSSLVVNKSIDSNGEPKDHDHDHRVVYDKANITTVTHLTNSTYITDGGTPLYDAVCKTINDIKKQIARMTEDKKPGRVIFVIMTDGEENTSKRFTLQQMEEMIKTQTDTHNWQVLFLGANQDAIHTADQTGVARGQSISFSPTDEGIKAVYMAASDTVLSKRSVSADMMRSIAFSEAAYTVQDGLIGDNMNMQYMGAVKAKMEEARTTKA